MATATGVRIAQAMRQAAQRLVGSHDFRNFCKIDAVNVLQFVRVILAFDMAPVTQAELGVTQHADATATTSRTNDEGDTDGVPAEPDDQVWAFTITGTAFLWHQVRCMVAILFLIGQGLERVEVRELLARTRLVSFELT